MQRNAQACRATAHGHFSSPHWIIRDTMFKLLETPSHTGILGQVLKSASEIARASLGNQRACICCLCTAFICEPEQFATCLLFGGFETPAELFGQPAVSSPPKGNKHQTSTLFSSRSQWLGHRALFLKTFRSRFIIESSGWSTEGAARLNDLHTWNNAVGASSPAPSHAVLYPPRHVCGRSCSR